MRDPELNTAYAQSPAALLAIEVPRMARVNANWPVLLATWCGLLGLGLALRFGVRRAWAEGLGTALVLVGALGVLIDTVSARRARPYTEALGAAAAADE